MFSKIQKNDSAFTGLEAAIVLIAFVVVAAVFSYVMLGAGFYTTQKSQEVVHTGVQQASSSIGISGDVIIKGDSDGDNASTLTFYVTSTAGGAPVDLDKTLITYADTSDFVSNCNWSYTGEITDEGTPDNLVEAGEKYQVVVNFTATSGITSKPTMNEVIKIEVKPPEGAVLALSRTMPPEISADSYYTVY
ncbi:flagellin FlaB [Methanohalophilus levihalophilus]|uniref:archaellin/type IV pilin N-terminal domain-containing protein n=1 Tax=Methanohalophilus levihalophilus TaxID=1431282 RepID=UPI001AE3C501|nr:archaellin/type IV pilin N-terminal domain-containing protein [Methanohalophilus levihalophilus]MBP2029979.1 flagellin FlaB [Methanohalophilus levihalophilus]